MSLVDRLNEKRATPETILETVRTAVYEISGDLPPTAMQRELESKLGQNVVIDLLAQLAADPDLVAEAAMAWLAVCQDDLEAQKIVEDTLEAADRSLPIFETAAITLVTLYAIYSFARIPKRHIHKIERKKDGRFIVTDEIVYDSFSEPLKGLVSFFKLQEVKHIEHAGDADD